jgi:hypothetical protein
MLPPAQSACDHSQQSETDEGEDDQSARESLRPLHEQGSGVQIGVASFGVVDLSCCAMGERRFLSSLRKGCRDAPVNDQACLRSSRVRRVRRASPSRRRSAAETPRKGRVASKGLRNPIFVPLTKRTKRVQQKATRLARLVAVVALQHLDLLVGNPLPHQLHRPVQCGVGKNAGNHQFLCLVFVLLGKHIGPE